MNAVVYHSNTGQSRAVAACLAEQLGWPLLDMTRQKPSQWEKLVLVFPVHCQNIPRAVAEFLDGVEADWLIPVATYGGMCHGNVLQQLQQRWNFSIPAAAYVPTQHSYLAGQVQPDLAKLKDLLPKIHAPSEIRLPRTNRNPLSDVFPALRSRMGVKLLRTDRCTNCGLCTQVCLHGAIDCGRTSRHCIRCLRCVTACPVGALEFRLRLPMRLYLAKKPHTDILLYT